ncbi:MAG: aspartate--tRNA ligase, partial [Verrucomicrobiota bacterium]
MFDYRRTHTCGELGSPHIGKIVTLSGWVHRRRDHGGIIFIDLRDRFGLTQLVFDPKTISEELFHQASRLRSEWVISIKGQVIARTEKMINHKLPTGELEIYVKELETLSSAKTPPFSICDEDIEVNEELRLKYRYLDIRRGLVADNLLLRHQVMLTTRNFMSEQGFIEISTPILGKSTPEGARDYLVPSRIYPGNFYALPQSPQIFKQLLMISGMDRYFQIAPCFRDEDLRADRQPEFTQIDMEMSFGTPEDIMGIIEDLMTRVIQTTSPDTPPISFPRMSYKDCLENYGTDHPDLRFKMPLVRLDDIIEQSEFTILREQLIQIGCI